MNIQARVANIHKQPTPKRNKNMGGWRYFSKLRGKDLVWNMHEMIIIYNVITK